jgi:hypothetical protein
MSSRRDQRERRREEREAREAAARKSQARRARLVQAGIGAALLVAVVVGIVLATGGEEDGRSQAAAEVRLPARQETDLEAAVQAAGCEYDEFESEGRRHIDPGGTYDDYETNPPNSGPHDPVPAEDGVYEPGRSPRTEAWVHTLEHGRIILQYRPGLPAQQRAQLEALYNEPNRGEAAYHMVLMESTTDMPYAAAAVAWTASVRCERITDRTWDAFRAFRDRYTDQAPELIP